MGVFGKIADAKFSEGGNYLGIGVHRLKIKMCKSMKTLTQKDAFIVEFEVLSSTNPNHVVGSDVTWMVTLDKLPALGNIKQFAMASIPCEEKDVTEAAIEYMCKEDVNPMKDKIVRANATNIKTKGKGADFTKVKFVTDSEGDAGAAAATG